MVEVYARMVRDVGFPIAVSGVLLWFLLTRLDPALGKLSDAMVDFTATIRRQTVSFEQAAKIGEENNERLRQLMGDAPWRRDSRETTRATTP